MSARRDLLAVAAFVCLTSGPFLAKPFHMDEPLFLAPAAHILEDPLHPLAFDYNWYGRRVPMATINNTPPLTLYALAAGLKVSGGGEAGLRLLFFPFDILGAVALYLLAARFLKRPLLPVLIALAGPGYLVSMSLLYPEKLSVPLGLLGLYAVVRGVDERDGRWYWGSAAPLAAGLLCKYAGILFLLPAAGYALDRGTPGRRVAAHAALAAAPAALAAGAAAWAGTPVFATAWSTTAWGASAWWSGWPHKLRSFLAFTGGCGLVTAVWPFAFDRRRSLVTAAACAALAVLLFSPANDGEPVRALDRALGLAFSLGAALSLAKLFSPAARKRRGWALWAPWALSAAVVQLCLYWGVLARLTTLAAVPLILAMAEALEAQWSRRALGALYGASLAAALAVSLPLACVDYDYARAQKSFAEGVARGILAQGRTVWFAGHWGWQYYLEKEGARPLDEARGGWSEPRPGDIVLWPVVNATLAQPPGLSLSGVVRWRIDSRWPLRLMSGWDGQGGYYSNALGFLPYSLSREPVDEFRAAELLSRR